MFLSLLAILRLRIDPSQESAGEESAARAALGCLAPQFVGDRSLRRAQRVPIYGKDCGSKAWGTLIESAASDAEGIRAAARRSRAHGTWRLARCGIQSFDLRIQVGSDLSSSCRRSNSSLPEGHPAQAPELGGRLVGRHSFAAYSAHGTAVNTVMIRVHFK